MIYTLLRSPLSLYQVSPSKGSCIPKEDRLTHSPLSCHLSLTQPFSFVSILSGDLLTKQPHKLSLLTAGDVSIFDTRCVHCGTENQSDKPRVLLYATFRNNANVQKGIGGKDQQDDYWNVASLRPEYAGKYTLRDFM